MESGPQIREGNTIGSRQGNLNRLFRRKGLEVAENPCDQIVVFAAPVTFNPAYEHSAVFGFRYPLSAVSVVHKVRPCSLAELRNVYGSLAEPNMRLQYD